MADLPGLRQLIQLEETRTRFALSESLMQKMGSMSNHIALYQYMEKRFVANGYYNIAGLPYLGVDGVSIAEFDMEIINVWMYCRDMGASGLTEWDLKYQTTPGGPLTSIFSTTPKIAYNAASGAWVGVGGSGTGLTAPVISTTDIDAGWALRADLLQAQAGNPNTTELIIHWRPR